MHRKLVITLLIITDKGMMMKKRIITQAIAAVVPVVLAAQLSHADMLDIEITNLNSGMYFTPLLISSHKADNHLFMAGESASAELQAMAEGGDIGPLDTLSSGYGAHNLLNPAGGLLAPATMTTAMSFDTGDNDHLSIVAMMLPTNDGFVGLDSWQIPHKKGQYMVYLNAYDAGTEANDEIVNGGGAPGTPGIPVIPGVELISTASGVTDMEQNQMVHIHRGNVGDTDTSGGVSDLDSRVHRWLNPVAKVVITVK